MVWIGHDGKRAFALAPLDDLVRPGRVETRHHVGKRNVTLRDRAPHRDLSQAVDGQPLGRGRSEQHGDHLILLSVHAGRLALKPRLHRLCNHPSGDAVSICLLF